VGPEYPRRRGNLEAIDFLRRMNELVYADNPECDHGGRRINRLADGVAADLFGRSRLPASSGTWVGCTTRLQYMSKDPIHRKFPNHHDLTVRAALPFTETSSCRSPMTEVGARKAAACEMPAICGQNSPTCVPITPSCTACQARSCSSWAPNSGQWRRWNHDGSLGLAPAPSC